MLRSIFLVILVIVVSIQAVFLIKLHKGSETFQTDIETERYSRLVAEKALQEAELKIKKLDMQFITLTKDLEKKELLLEQEKEYALNLTKKLQKSEEKNIQLERDLKRIKEVLGQRREPVM